MAVTHALTKSFDTHVYVLEASQYDNGVLRSVLGRKVVYRFVKDNDPVLYKTSYFNRMAQSVTTPYLAIWDADIAPDRKAIVETVGMLRQNRADAAYPYNGLCYDVPDIIRRLYIRGTDFRILRRNMEKMNPLYEFRLYGGAVFVSKDRYMDAGMENEAYYGWGNDDFDRYARFCESGLTIYRSDNPLFHLYHPRGENSQYITAFKKKRSDAEFQKRNNTFFRGENHVKG